MTRPAAGARVEDADRSTSREGGDPSGPLRIAVVAPVAQRIPPARSGSVESVTALLVEGLVDQGHDVTLFATGTSETSAALHVTFTRGYREDPDLWPWEMCELLNVAAAVERADSFDVIHYQANYGPTSLAFTKLTETPLVVTLHHAPSPGEVSLWSRYPDAPFIAVSEAQARMLAPLSVAGIVHHAVDTDVFVPRGEPAGDLVFLGRFTEGKGVVEAIEIARRAGLRLALAAAPNDYYESVVAPLVDGQRIAYVGELGPSEKAALLAGARALLYPVQAEESFGLVMAEAMSCGTPVAALRRGPVAEIVDDGVTGRAFDTVDDLISGLAGVLTLDRKRVRARAVERFGRRRMIEEHVAVYRHLIAQRRRAMHAL